MREGRDSVVSAGRRREFRGNAFNKLVISVGTLRELFVASWSSPKKCWVQRINDHWRATSPCENRQRRLRFITAYSQVPRACRTVASSRLPILLLCSVHRKQTSSFMHSQIKSPSLFWTALNCWDCSRNMDTVSELACGKRAA